MKSANKSILLRMLVGDVHRHCFHITAYPASQGEKKAQNGKKNNAAGCPSQSFIT